MISSFGPGSDMKKSQKQNKSLLKKRSSLKELNEQGHAEKGTSSLTFKEASDEELSAYRIKLAEKQQREKLRNRIVLAVVVLLVTGLFLWILL